MVTQELKPVPRAALELRHKLQELEKIPRDEVREWLAELDPQLDAGSINFVIGHGMNHSRRWWHEDAEGFLVNGPKEAPISSEHGSTDVAGPLSDEVKKPQLLDPGEMSEPRDQFYTIALNIGIPEKAARIAAYSCWNTGEMSNPAEAWQAILQCSSLVPSQKRSLWRNWCAWAGVKIPDALAEKVEKQFSTLSSTDISKDRAVAPAPARRFIPVKGEVVMVEPDDSGGMPFSEALRAAELQQKLQNESGGPSGSRNDVVVALIHEAGANQRASGENQRALFELLKPTDSGGRDTLLLAHLDSQRRETEVRFQQMEEMRRKDDELARQREETRWQQAQDREDRREQNLTRLMEQLSANTNQSKNPFDMLDQVLPGIGARLLENILNPPRQQGEFMVTLGDQGKMSLDDYERYSTIQGKREVIQMARQRLPELFQLGRDLLTATERARSRDREEEPVARQPGLQKDTSFDGYCVQCLRVVNLPVNVEEFTCPYPDCGALQSMAGEVMAVGKPKYTAEPLKPEETIIDAQLVNQEELVDREHPEDFVAPQPPARELTEEPVAASGVPNAG